MKYLFLSIFTIGIFLGLTSCGKETARIPFTQSDVFTSYRADTTPEFASKIKSVSIPLKKGEFVGVWTDLKVKYMGELGMEYRIIVIRDNKDTVDHFTCDPFNVSVTLNSVKTNMNGKHSDRYEGKMGKFEAKTDGSYTFQAALWLSDNPTAELTRADLVFKK
jgi:hypothetical protein